MSGLKGADCRKFQANIFNKSKCTNCFKQREEHSPEALESNRASRKVSKCGYLFVAPDWDFSIPLNRTKRWQRRWFVLYDDGELTYSLDDHPATIPQGVVDMNRVLEVSSAEEVTGNQYSLAITAPERVTFIKATCKEEAKWWMDVLSVFPGTLKQGRHKRNATFPGIKTNTAKQTRHTAATMAPTAFETAAGQRVRFHSCTTDPMLESRPQSAPAHTLDAEEDVFPTKDNSSFPSPTSPTSTTTTTTTTINTPTSRCFSTPISTSVPPPLPSLSPTSPSSPSSTPLFSSLPPSSSCRLLVREEHKESTPYCGDYSDNPPTSESPPTQDKLSHKLRARRSARRAAEGGRGSGHTHTSRTGDVSRRQLISDLEESKREEKLKDIADSLTRPRGGSSAALSYVSTKPGAGDVKPTRESDAAAEEMFDPPVTTTTTTTSSSTTTTSTRHHQGQDTSAPPPPPPPAHPDHVRGDPDGCGLELSSSPYTASPDLQRVDLPAEDLLYIKKGWLMKQSLTQEWIKFWFVLRGSGLMFYRDPGAEDNGILAGIIDLTMAKSVEESEVARNYGFIITTFEEKKYTFSAVTSGIRGNWVQALRNAANLKEQKDRPLTLGEKIEREIVVAKKRTNSQGSAAFESMAAEREKDTLPSPTNNNNNSNNNNNNNSSSRHHFIFSSEEGEDDDDDDDDDDDEDDDDDDDNFCTASENSSTRLHFQTSEDVCDWGGNSRLDKTTTSTTATTSSSSVTKAAKPSPRITSSSVTKDDYLTTTTTTTTNTTSSSSSGSSSSSSSSSRDGCYIDTGSLHSIFDLDERLQPEKEGPSTTTTTTTTTLPSSGDALLVDLLETQVESLKAKLEQTQHPVGGSGRSRDKLEVELSEARQSINALKGDLKRLRKRLEMCEGDLDRSEREADQLRRDKENVVKDCSVVRRRATNLEIQVKELLDRVEEQEHHLTEKTTATNQLNELRKKSLQEAEKKKKKVSSWVEESEATATPRKHNTTTTNTTDMDTRQHNQQLSLQLEHMSSEMGRMRDKLKCEKSEVYKWKDLVKELRSLLDGKNEEIDRKREELDEVKERLKETQKELEHTTDRLHRGIEENENLCTKVRELERSLRQDKEERRASSSLSVSSSSRERFASKKTLVPRIDSLSDLTNVDMSVEPEDMHRQQLEEHCSDVRLRLERAVGEIRALKRQLRESQERQDHLELSNLQLRQDMKGSQGDFNSQLNLMTCRIQDLTNKLTNSEKQVEEEKGRAGGDKSTTAAGGGGGEGGSSSSVKAPRRSRSFEESTKSSRLRRKSLDSPGSCDAMKAVVRLNALEAKVSDIANDGAGGGVVVTGSSNGGGDCVIPDSTTKTPSRARSPAHSAASPLRSVPPHSRSPIRSPSLPRRTLRSPRTTPDKTSPSTTTTTTPSTTTTTTTTTSRSESEIRYLKERVSALDKVLSTLHTQLGECVSWAGAVECVCSCGAPGLSSLQQRLGGALHMAQLRHTSVDQAEVTRVQPLTLKLQEMLRDKLAELYNRRDHLKNEGKWTREVQVKMFAERLAYETVVLSQLAQVMQATQPPHTHHASTTTTTSRLQELVEAHRKLSFLEKKLTNSHFDTDTLSLSPLDFYTSLLAEKLVVQGEVMSHPSSPTTPTTPPAALGETCRDLQARLLERERNLAALLTEYKEKKLYQIAVVMARETIAGTGPVHDETVLVEEVRMRQVWTLAQELVSQEMANTEAGQALHRMAHLLSPDGRPPLGPGAWSWPSAAALERCHRAAEESLRQEMEEAVFTLSNKYEGVLARHRAGDASVVESVCVGMEALLEEFAGVAAQKAVLDGQLAVVVAVQGEAAPETLAIVEEVKDAVESASDVVGSEAHLLMFLGGGDASLESIVQPALDQAEFTFMYNRATTQSVAEVARLVQEASKTPTPTPTPTPTTKTTGAKESESAAGGGGGGGVSKSSSSPKMRRKSETRRSLRRSSDVTGMTGEVCRQCEEMRQEVARLRRCMGGEVMECKQCLVHLASIKNLKKEHEAALTALKNQHKEEVARLTMPDDVTAGGVAAAAGPVSTTTDGELTELQRRLSLLEEGYEAQITALKHQYEEALGTQPDMCEEKVRQRYQVEIEHLRGLCEKGLGAMENSHKRMLMEMEEKHRRELAALQAEKEQALAEETQATLAALDAMRKAHESEVQREIAKFKEEFIRKMQSGHDLTAIHRQHEAEMEDIRKEILSLSQKYSVKCLESASLEEKLDSLTRQLTDVNKQMFDLQARNKQLKVHLTAQVSQLQGGEGKKQQHQQDPETQLRIYEAELGLMKEEVARLTQQLHQAQTHENELGDLCRQLGQFLKAERQLRTDEVATLRDKLEAILLTAAAMQEQWKRAGESEEGSRHHHQPTPSRVVTPTSHTTRPSPQPPPPSNKELLRSPSCPRLSGVSSFLSGGPWQWGTGPPPTTQPSPAQPDLPSPLAGMVATRKKVFETRHSLLEPL